MLPVVRKKIASKHAWSPGLPAFAHASSLYSVAGSAAPSSARSSAPRSAIRQRARRPAPQ